MVELMKGNQAIAEAAVRAGVTFYAGYPITPSSEIMEHLSERLPELGGTFIQAESEVAGITMVMGAAACGVRALTASSGPGMSLKQEGISCISDEELSCVIVNVARFGNGLGTLLSSQCDYLRETRGGGNGDYRCIVLCPESIQEAVDFMSLAFDLAEKYRIISVLLTEGALGQMMEPCTLPDFIEPKKLPWGFDGKYSYKKIGIFDRNPYKEGLALKEKHNLIKANEQRYENIMVDDADYVFVAYGLAARACKGVVKELREEGHKVGLIRVISAWPFPEKAFSEIHSEVKAFISVEANATGQLIEDVVLYAKKAQLGNIPVYSILNLYGIPSIKETKEKYKKILSGEVKEDF